MWGSNAVARGHFLTAVYSTRHRHRPAASHRARSRRCDARPLRRIERSALPAPAIGASPIFPSFVAPAVSSFAAFATSRAHRGPRMTPARTERSPPKGSVVGDGTPDLTASLTRNLTKRSLQEGRLEVDAEAVEEAEAEADRDGAVGQGDAALLGDDDVS